MSADLNHVALVGRLTRAPEMRRMPDGDAVATIRLAFTTRRRDGDGEWTDHSNYIDVSLFGRRAELAEEHLDKGRRIGVGGRLSWREWTTAAGEQRQGVEVVASESHFLDARPGADAGTG